ncbi:MAG: NADP-dependent phosphogluconate dehydrogenase [Pseudomonadota bacterium]
MAQLGLIGIGVMGSALAQNLAENGHDVAMLDRTMSKMQAVIDSAQDQGLPGKLTAHADAQALIDALPAPRAILVLVPSGAPLRSVVDTLKPLLAKGDLIADLGNSNYTDTQAYVAELEAEGLEFIGMGISGGAEGARHGPSIMAGGSKDSWARIVEPLSDAAAKFEGDPCCDWFGPGGSGHFIKMIHNGIEYAVMQLIAEAYGVMKHGLRMPTEDIGQKFTAWNKGHLDSYLMKIAAEVLSTKDPITGNDMVEMILDQAGQKGTGRWSVIEALHLGAPSSMMAAAVEARNISALKEDRIAIQSIFGASQDAIPTEIITNDKALDALESALILATILAYSQGMEIIRRASVASEWNLDLAAIARVWRAGCIIRSSLLDNFSDFFEGSPDALLIEDPAFEKEFRVRGPLLQMVASFGLVSGNHVPVFAAATNYYNLMRSGQGTANMIQALRDRFGAHSFERMDNLGQKVIGPWHDK